MEVTICGPNLNDQSKGQFHVHAAGCADLKRHATREPVYEDGWTIEATSRLDVCEAVYSDHMAERPEGDPYHEAAAYLPEFHFFPCASDLPTQGQEEITREEEQRLVDETMADVNYVGHPMHY